MNKLENTVDVVIIGGGPAGMSAALVLGRARKTVIVLDEELPRNRVTHESHGFLTRDGITPGKFRQIARAEISVYPSVHFVKDSAVSIIGQDGDFQVTAGQGEVYLARKILIASGMKDLPLDIAGLNEVYGSSAFVCPYCDGWELQDQTLVLIAKGSRAVHMAKILSGWTKHFTLCTNGPDDLSDEQRVELQQHQIPLFDQPIQRIENKKGIVERVVLEDGTEIRCTGIFFAPKLAPGSDLAQSLGCQLTETGVVVVEGFGKTSVAGVYSAGDAATEAQQLIAAAAAGSLAAAGINGELQFEAWDRVEELKA
ncbi:NAD(P)/FAD-dependent oxidoreductase [Paenibacillus agricola]|uniref:NAD(P)/FAD-dependent oxidoreductase n=1 Tax=Paenibacillus agricola TaxID=2716264 RepID=A0ABX0J118_9BACL|nr:NAD(P)/FAD-dependent oxidoreductase [Paenibacillus agricola]NHN28587.1 NAD(P)/FAD-dependent oxidoreductase [Paenibacillus agricola]